VFTHRFPSISKPAITVAFELCPPPPGGQSAGASTGVPGSAEAAAATRGKFAAAGAGVDAGGFEVVGEVVVLVGAVVVVDAGLVAAGFAVVGGVVVGVVVVGVVVAVGSVAVGSVVDGVVVVVAVVASAAACVAADGRAVDWLVVLTDADTVVLAGWPATVNDVAHGLPAAQLPPCGNAAVVSLAPTGTVEATVTWNVVVAREFEVPGAPNAGTAQESVLACASSVKRCWDSCAALDEIVAFARRPERSSTTVAPEGRAASEAASRV